MLVCVVLVQMLTLLPFSVKQLVPKTIVDVKVFGRNSLQNELCVNCYKIEHTLTHTHACTHTYNTMSYLYSSLFTFGTDCVCDSFHMWLRELLEWEL